MKPPEKPGPNALVLSRYSYRLRLLKAYLLTSGTIFALIAPSHLFITVGHWRQSNAGTWDVLAPGAIFAISTALNVWAFRLPRRTS